MSNASERSHIQVVALTEPGHATRGGPTAYAATGAADGGFGRLSERDP